ncbi:MAG: D-glycero-beta-D-manno-heptose 1-phosphate adenylyltransferase [Candidatus Sumerlaeia bacterium]
MTSESKIVTRAEAAELARRERDLGHKVVFTNGCFDLLHPAHVRLLEYARAQGEFLIVAVNSDESVRRLKGPSRPILPARERARILASLEMVGAVTVFEEDTPAAIIEELEPDVLVKGGDYGPGEVVGEDYVNRRGGVTLRFPTVQGVGTSAVIRKIVEKFGPSKAG